ncbi:MAG: hypothetical protein KF872_03815 [Chitinophagales bacterium]|nr:hypothetical protein [Chitinophagales bacterium]
MKLLLVCNHRDIISDTLQWFQQQHAVINDNNIAFKQHKIEILETGFGGFKVGFHLTECILKSHYNLILKLSEAHALMDSIAVGQVVNIVRDFPASDGNLIEDSFKDLYDTGYMHTAEHPHQLGGLVNKTNSYLNVFLPYKKVFSITSAISSHHATLKKIRIEKYKPHIETVDGIYFSYPCLWKRVSFYHLAAVIENLVTGEKNIALAKQELNKELIEIIQKL